MPKYPFGHGSDIIWYDLDTFHLIERLARQVEMDLASTWYFHELGEKSLLAGKRWLFTMIGGNWQVLGVDLNGRRTTW